MTINVNDWSETPASNTTIDGNNIAESCTPSVLNNMGRAIMAGVRTFKIAYDALVVTVADKMPKTAGTFSGAQPIYTGEGAFIHHANAANTSGKLSVLAEGSARPSSPVNGDIVLYYAP